MRRPFCVLVFALVPVFTASCRTQPPKVAESKDYARPLPEGMMALEKVTDPAQYPDFGQGYEADAAGLIAAVEESMKYFSKPSSKKPYPYLDISHDRAQASLAAFKRVVETAKSPEDLNAQIVAKFDVYRSVGYDGRGTVLYTGYCEPIYNGSREPTSVYRYPLYKLPPDLVKKADGTCLGRKTPGGGTVPYYTRREIDTMKALAGKGLEICYVGSKLEAFICHVQGSARVKLADGREIKLGYAGKNEAPYASLGGLLVKDGRVPKDKMSLTAIKEYFAAHPEELDYYIYQNPSYVFFSEREGGPFGCLGVAVTPYHSLATDKAVFPPGCIGFYDTAVPAYTGPDTIDLRPMGRFAMDQDRGGAIRSAGRSDIFLGTGPPAERLAGYTQHEGRLFYVFVKAGSAP